ncbi:MAG: hypothetical protein R2724_02635 [Bryobacterales bacterium]
MRTPAHHALWEVYASYFDGQGWSPMTLVPYSTGRNDMRIEIARDPSGRLVAAWPTDRRNFRDFVNMLPDVFTARMPQVAAKPKGFELSALRLPPVEPAIQPPNRPRRDVAPHGARPPQRAARRAPHPRVRLRDERQALQDPSRRHAPPHRDLLGRLQRRLARRHLPLCPRRRFARLHRHHRTQLRRAGRVRLVAQQQVH